MFGFLEGMAIPVYYKYRHYYTKITDFFPLIELIRYQGLNKDVMTYIEKKVDIS